MQQGVSEASPPAYIHIILCIKVFTSVLLHYYTGCQSLYTLFRLQKQHKEDQSELNKMEEEMESKGLKKAVKKEKTAAEKQCNETEKTPTHPKKRIAVVQDII